MIELSRNPVHPDTSLLVPFTHAINFEIVAVTRDNKYISVLSLRRAYYSRNSIRLCQNQNHALFPVEVTSSPCSLKYLIFLLVY